MQIRCIIFLMLWVIMNGCTESRKNEDNYKVPLQVNHKTDPAYANIHYESKFVPPDGKFLFIAGQDKKSIERFVKAWGMIPGGFSVYFVINDDTKCLWTDSIYDPYEIKNAKWLADSFSNTVLQMALWLVGKALDWGDFCGDTVRGKYNNVLDSFCKFAQTYHRPIYLRIGYEFDGKHNKLEPEEYKKAYRYIVDYIRSQKVSNVAFVWHSYVCPTYKNYDVMDWYPGDSYVDWFGMSVFGWQFNDKIHYFEISFIWDIKEHFYSPIMERFVNLAKDHKKPIMICESSPVGDGGITAGNYKTWNNWFVPYLNYIHLKNIKAFSYINCDWSTIKQWSGYGWGNSRIEDAPLILDQWTNEMEKDCYLKQSSKLYKILGFKE